jgi:hypothetical protein
MFLTSTSDIIRVVTGSAVANIEVSASWVDLTSSAATPGRTLTEISTATTTTVVAAPAASTYRNVRHLNIINNNASASCAVTVQHFDGTTSIDIEKVTLKAGESLVICEDGEFRHLTPYGAEYEYQGSTVFPNLGPTGTIAETMPRELCIESNITGPTSGTMYFNPVFLKAGQVINNISFYSATTAAATPTNQVFAIYDRNGKLMAKTVDDTTTAWAANSQKTLALTAAWTVPKDGPYFVALLVAAATVPSLTASSSTLNQANPIFRGSSNTGLTAPPGEAAMPTGNSSLHYATMA